jgi:hypothetical protein
VGGLRAPCLHVCHPLIGVGVGLGAVGAHVRFDGEVGHKRLLQDGAVQHLRLDGQLHLDAPRVRFRPDETRVHQFHLRLRSRTNGNVKFQYKRAALFFRSYHKKIERFNKNSLFFLLLRKEIKKRIRLKNLPKALSRGKGPPRERRGFGWNATGPRKQSFAACAGGRWIVAVNALPCVPRPERGSPLANSRARNHAATGAEHGKGPVCLSRGHTGQPFGVRGRRQALPSAGL